MFQLKKNFMKLFHKYKCNIYEEWVTRGNYYINEKLSDSYQIMYDVIASKVLEYKPTRVLEYGCGYG